MLVFAPLACCKGEACLAPTINKRLMFPMSDKMLHVMTFGCQMNEHDSERIAGVMRPEGYVHTPEVERADLIIVNTCSIRDKAEHKFFSELGRIRRYKEANPGVLIGIAGCLAQQEGEAIMKRAPYVDIVFGTSNIPNLPALVRKRIEQDERVTDVDFDKEYNLLDMPADRGDGLKAWVSIMYGCDNFCSYCVVPFTRGREISRPAKNIREEIAGLAAQGYKEVTLLGQNVNSYGKGLDDGCDFPGLLSFIHDVNGIERIRFMTSHPKDLSDGLVSAIAELPKLCEGVHLPMQSGSDRVLSLMRRGYTFESYRERVARLREAIPGLCLTSDIIVGFPGETEDDFRATVSAIEEIGFDSIYLFQYSPRPDTRAREMPDQVSEEEKSRRFVIIKEMQDAINLEKNRRLEGDVREVLVEGIGKKDAGVRVGRDRGGKMVSFPGDCERGCLVPVRITEGMGYALKGEMA